MRAVIYARYSSHAQKDTSIEQQLRVCRQYAEEHDLQIVGEYCDRAISGTSDKRPEFLKMIKDSAKGKWQRVLVYKVDRFARNRYDSAMYKAKLKKSLSWKGLPSITPQTCPRISSGVCARTPWPVK